MQNELKPMYLCWISIFSDSESKYEKYMKLSDFLSSQYAVCMTRRFQTVETISVNVYVLTETKM